MRRFHLILLAAMLASAIGASQSPRPARAASSNLSYSPSSIYFGSIIVGAVSNPQTVTIRNNGSADVTLGTLTVTEEFNLKARDCNGKTLAPNETCTFSVTFTPASATYRYGAVSIPNSASATPDTVSLSGYGITGTNLLRSPGFELPFPKPLPWRSETIPSLTNVWDCSVSLSPFCSFRLSGKVGNSPQILIQSIGRTGLAGNKYLFRLSSKARNVPAGGQYKVEVQLWNMYNRVVGSKSLDFSIGTHDFETLTGTIAAKTQYSWVIFRIIYQNRSGMVWFDEAQLIVIP